MAVVCQCGHTNSPGSNFCASCGTRLAGAPTAPSPAADGSRPVRGGAVDRRQVTVMFCDLVDSTALSVRLDPEDLRGVINAYYRQVTETVGRYDGFVAQYYGDGVLVYFGYPQAHERPAERAAGAGLEIIAAVRELAAPVQLNTRIGIATGLVVAGDLFESSETQRHGIVGETPNLAARLQAVAQPDTVVIDESTRTLIGDAFDLTDLGPIALKGSGSVRAWSVQRASTIESRFDALHAGGLTPLVGREEEVDLLLRRWEQTKEGEGQAVLLSGEGGIGKSRLTSEVLQLVKEAHTRLRYFCSPLHSSSALYPVVSQLERAAGFELEDTPRTRLEKLDALLLRTATSIEDRAVLAELLSLPNDGRYPALELSPQQRRQKILDALGSQFAALARLSPLLVLFEDAHWIDPTSLELLGQVLDRLAELPALLIVTFRPEFDAPWIGRPNVTMLTLNRLPQRQIMSMIDGVLGNKELPAALRKDIIERTDGVPLFVEEMTKAVLEAANPVAAEQTLAAAPARPSTVPASLHASLLSRLDRLGPAKEAVEIGAAIGREFSHALLAAVARLPEAALQSALERALLAGLLLRQGVAPHASYRFKHALMQEAAYGTLLLGKRETLHARIADVYERQFHDVVEAQPAMLAHHLSLAGFSERAIAFWLKAAHKAVVNGAIAEAVTQLERALVLIADVTDKTARRRLEIDLQIALGNALMALRGYSAEETDAAFRRARELCIEPADNPQLVRVLWGQYTGNFAGGRERAALDLAEELLTLSEELGDDAGRQLGHASVGASLLHLGFLSRARPHFDGALSAAAGSEREWAYRYGQSGKVVAHSYLSLDLLLLGFADQGRGHAEQAIAEAQRLSHPPSLCFAHSIVCRFYYLLGDADRLGEHAAIVARLADEQRLGLWQALGSIYVGWGRAAMGATDDARGLIREGIAKYRSVGAGLGVPLYLASLAKLEAQTGRFQEAMRLVKEATAVVDSGEEGWMSAELHRISAEIILLDPDGDRAQAQSQFEQALHAAESQEARFWKLRAALGMARLWRDDAKRQQALDVLTPVYHSFGEGLMVPDLRQAKDLLNALAS